MPRVGVLDVEAQRMLDAHVVRERVEQHADAVVAASMVPATPEVADLD
jgi:hypothetical protein